jgi:predicted phosphodiesterase
MRYLVLSDLHANLPALDAVLLHAKQRGYDDVMFLGDAVGYYPHPEEVLDRLVALNPSVKILGNHDAALLAMLEEQPERSRDASVVTEVLERHLAALSNDSVRFLQSLQPAHVADDWEATHGALVKPWEYMSNLGAAQANLPLMRTRLLFVGHTHFPKVFAAAKTVPRAGSSEPGQELWRTITFRHEQGQYRVPPHAHVIANPGAVGQPRDHIPLAAYALFDVPTRSIDFHRVEFDVAAVQADVRAAGYPEVLAARLALGR